MELICKTCDEDCKSNLKYSLRYSFKSLGFKWILYTISKKRNCNGHCPKWKLLYDLLLDNKQKLKSTISYSSEEQKCFFLVKEALDKKTVLSYSIPNQPFQPQTLALLRFFITGDGKCATDKKSKQVVWIIAISMLHLFWRLI